MAGVLTVLVMVETFLTGYLLRNTHGLQRINNELIGRVAELDHDVERLSAVVAAISER